MSVAGQANPYLLNGRHATNKYTRVCAPVTGSVNAIVGPDQSTSTDCPALCPTRETSPET